MYKNQINKFTMAINAAAFLGENEELISSLPELQNHISMLNAKCNEIEMKDTERATIRKGMRDSKLNAKYKAINKALGVSGAVYAYAMKNQNIELAEKSRIYKTNLEFMRDAELSAKLRFIKELAYEYIQDLGPFGISNEKLNQYDEVIRCFEKAISDSGSSIAIKKGNLNSIKVLFRELNDIFTATDKLVDSFLDVNPDFVNNYKIIRRIKKFGLRHRKEPQLQNLQPVYLPVNNTSS